MRQIARRGDMGQGVKLRLTSDDDGDISVCIGKESDKWIEPSIEFCASGGHSEKTLAALRALMRAMMADEDARPHYL